MKDLKIDATYKTPLVDFNRNGQMSISGRSIPENGFLFYQPVFNWIEEYCTRPVEKTTFDIYLEYINTASSKCLLDVLKVFEKIKHNGSEVIINWHYKEEETDILEAGQDYDSILNLKFSFIEEI